MLSTCESFKDYILQSQDEETARVCNHDASLRGNLAWKPIITLSGDTRWAIYHSGPIVGYCVPRCEQQHSQNECGKSGMRYTCVINCRAAEVDRAAQVFMC